MTRRSATSETTRRTSREDIRESEDAARGELVGRNILIHTGMVITNAVYRACSRLLRMLPGR